MVAIHPSDILRDTVKSEAKARLDLVIPVLKDAQVKEENAFMKSFLNILIATLDELYLVTKQIEKVRKDMLHSTDNWADIERSFMDDLDKKLLNRFSLEGLVKLSSDIINSLGSPTMITVNSVGALLKKAFEDAGLPLN